MTSFFTTTHALQTALAQSPTDENANITGWSIDTRTLQKGNVFIALTGHLPAPFTTKETPNNDGHQFLEAAKKVGAAAAIVSTPDHSIDLPQIVVKDTFVALWHLAQHVRTETKAKIIAITGSAGKTTCKDMLVSLLNAHGPVVSYNNAWGVPLTLLRLPREQTHCILELGMNQPGEMSELSKLANPHIAIVLNTLPVHTAGVGGLNGVIKEKCSIADGLAKNGTLILNEDIPTENLQNWPPKNINIIKFGQNTPNYAKLTQTNPTTAIIDQQSHTFDLQNPTEPRQTNALIALLAAKIAGTNISKVTPNLATTQTPNGRGNIIKINEITVIDDSYNANPASVKAALNTLKSLPTKGKRYALLGDMKELGPEEVNYHKDLAAHCTDIDGIFTCGDLMQHLANALPNAQHLYHFQDAKNINLNNILNHLSPNDILVVKGSNSGFYAQQTVQKLVNALQG